MSGKLVEAIVLKNGLKLEIRDHSRLLAGDRWLVSLEAKAQIPLSKAALDSLPDKEKVFRVLRKIYGDSIPYIYKQEKHFVDQGEKDRLFEEFLTIMKQNTLRYLEHPEFARRLIVSKVRELKTKNPRLFLEE